MPTRREYLAFAFYVTFSFAVADPAAVVRSTVRSIADVVNEETAQTRELVDGLDTDEKAFLGRYAICAATNPTDIISFTIRTYFGDDPRSECVDFAK